MRCDAVSPGREPVQDRRQPQGRLPAAWRAARLGLWPEMSRSVTWKLPEGAHRPAPSGNLGACSLPASSLAHIPLKTGEARGGAGQQGARALRRGLCAGAPETLPPLQGQEGQAGPRPLPGTRRFRSLGRRSPRGPEQRAFGDVESGTQTSFVYFRGASLNAGGLFLGMTSLLC